MSDKNGVGGRPEKLSEAKLLRAIGRHQTISASILSKKLHIDRTTIWRKLKKIDPQLIEDILAQIKDDELKPTERTYHAFIRIPIVADYIKRLKEKRKVSPQYLKQMVRGFFNICKIINKHPSKLTTKESVKFGAQLIVDIEQGRVKRGLITTRKCLRAWYLNQGISKEYISGEGISGEASIGTGKRATVRLTRDERHNFMTALKTKVKGHWRQRKEGKKKGWGAHIAFDTEYKRRAMLFLPKALYYMGTRKMAIHATNWHDVTFGDPITTIKTLEKGLHRKGRKLWIKRLSGDPLEEFKALWKLAGEPTEGLVFPFNPDATPALFKECYVDAGISEQKYKGMPLHVWRHTACQDLLEATDFNWEVTARILGWDYIDTMKRHYGQVSETVIQRGLLKAQGVEVPEEKREFKF